MVKDSDLVPELLVANALDLSHSTASSALIVACFINLNVSLP